MGPGLGLSTREVSGARAVLAVEGRLNATTAPEARARIQELVGQGRAEIVVDLSQVGFLDSSGLSALVSGLKAARERGGTLKLAGLSEQVGRIFKLTMLDRVFELYPSVEAALA
jgi:anti-sigma B factor antagonist